MFVELIGVSHMHSPTVQEAVVDWVVVRVIVVVWTTVWVVSELEVVNVEVIVVVSSDTEVDVVVTALPTCESLSPIKPCDF